MMNTPMRVCSQCHTPLAASESVCRNCGASYLEPNTTAMTEPTAFVADRSASRTAVHVDSSILFLREKKNRERETGKNGRKKV